MRTRVSWGPCRGPSRAGSGEGDHTDLMIFCLQTGRTAEVVGMWQAQPWLVQAAQAHGSVLPWPAGPTSRSSCTRGCRSRSAAGNASG